MATAAQASEVGSQQPSSLGRKIRILSLHGGGSNSKINAYQTQYLRNTLGDLAEWEFLEGTILFNLDPKIHGNRKDYKILKYLSKGSPIRSWYDVELEDNSNRSYNDKLFDPSVTVRYSKADEGAERVLKYLRSKGPFDVIVGFSQGCAITHLVVGLLRERNEEPPWRLSLFFSGMGVRDTHYLRWFSKPIDHPSVMVFGRNDEFYRYGKASQVPIYKQPLVLEHDEGHKFPGNNEAGKALYAQVVKEILWHCGIAPTFRPKG
eukprot:gnl/MRDRNA2_/MRDRNA2_162142_c0_seq1.p1 gnl/MRDRNA2_/MRDRNA2_162142_c0~~gnl/MRDRNA2_/MRDRNA2_162142_c0_seq1.p1  ORF type:complete len:306 (+),score=40.94 gnl/MRDRNA2_/MRDRNA2_162142_c0_seq1:132-920(+)